MVGPARARLIRLGGFLRQRYVLFPFYRDLLTFLLAALLVSALSRVAGYVAAGVLAVGLTVVNIQNYQCRWPKKQPVAAVRSGSAASIACSPVPAGDLRRSIPT